MWFINTHTEVKPLPLNRTFSPLAAEGGGERAWCAEPDWLCYTCEELMPGMREGCHTI